MRRRRNPFRWLAPIALVACAFAVYSVVDAGLLSDDSESSQSPAARSSTAGEARTVSERSKSSKRRHRRTRTYTVKSGDTLSSIAEEFYGDPDRFRTIFQANRNILDDPDEIFPGQELRIPQ